MIESLLQQAKPTADQGAAVRSAGRVTFDGRHPKLLDHRDHVLRVTAGHLDIFAVGNDESGAGGPRHPLFRVESNELLLDLQSGFSSSDLPIQVLAVGSAGAEALLVPRTDIQSSDLLVPWIRRLAGLTTGENPSWDMLEVASNGDAAIAPGDRRRGPARSIAWVSLEAGTARQMGLGPAICSMVLMQRHGLDLSAIDLWEINEAFAAQVLGCLAAWEDDTFCREVLGLPGPAGSIPRDRLNVDGGAIGIGHPVGASGNRIVLHLINAMRQRGLKRGIASQCVGGGQGGAMLLETV